MAELLDHDLDFLLSVRRDAAAAKRFFRTALAQLYQATSGIHPGATLRTRPTRVR